MSVRVVKLGSREFLHAAEFVIPVDKITEIDLRYVNGHACRVSTKDRTYVFGSETTDQLVKWVEERKTVR